LNLFLFSKRNNLTFFFFGGINEIRKCLPNLNGRLDNSLQSANVSGHSGRRSFATNCVNAGVDPSIIAQSTKHKSLKTLMGYVEKNDKVLGAAGLALGKKMKPDSGSTFGGHSTLGQSSSSSSSAAFEKLSCSTSTNKFERSSSSRTDEEDRTDKLEEKKYILNFTFN
jgi:hypothetical protein